MSSAARRDDPASAAAEWLVTTPAKIGTVSGNSALHTFGTIGDAGTARFALAATPWPNYRPGTYRTLLSDGDLIHCGLKVHLHEAEQWLVSIDADTLNDNRPSDTWYDALAARFQDLREAVAEEDGPLNEASVADALTFALEVHATVRPSAFVLDNGNARLVWENDRNEQIGLQFLGDGDIQYVLFAERSGRSIETYGLGQRDIVLRVVSATALRHLLQP